MPICVEVGAASSIPVESSSKLGNELTESFSMRVCVEVGAASSIPVESSS
eukprot:CAMPEP_0180438972 /NCGR_PEP_ID=MMETSP1036_2-20121128/12346_1 /TAXON_ID=632150 /ORGANISM="Azadinium spinosum, Strain 3D9" /LENGTH=49 /DNA_ID= /DNA_START= /DNA_END= /DNA_ORIENTATION=